jgi:acetoin utilization deacetylase AcuC-like enzyme
MRKVGIVYDDIYLKHENPFGHPERTERLRSIMEALRGSDVWEQLVQIKPRKAAFEELEYVHSHSHVEHMKKFTGYADPDTYVSEGSLEAALYAAGGVMEAVDRCRAGEIGGAFCAVRPPGHHAERDGAMGFCLFNNVAVAARHAQKKGYEKVFIIDFDVHHGNGTQHIFEEDGTVFYFSTHQHPHYPGTGSQGETGRGAGEGTTANYPMTPGSGDKDYYMVYHDILPGLMDSFAPDMVLVSAGYDLLHSDPLANIRISTEGLRTILHGILSYRPEGREIPAVFALEGGYDVDALAQAVLLTIRELISS